MMKDRDELIIREAFESISLPKTDIASGVQKRLAKRTKVFRRKLTLYILVAILMLSTVTAANMLGSFERLTELIGTDRASYLIPVEISNIRLSENMIADNGMKIEVVAVGLDNNAIDIYIKLKDLIADRLQGDILVALSVERNSAYSLAAFWNGEIAIHEIAELNLPIGSMSIINRCDSGVVTLRERVFFDATDTRISKLTINIHKIYYNIIQHEILADIDLSEASTRSETMFINEVHHLQFDGFRHTGDVRHDTFPVYAWDSARGSVRHYEGIYVLAPNQSLYTIGVDGITTGVSGIGIIDDRFVVLSRTAHMPADRFDPFALQIPPPLFYLANKTTGQWVLYPPRTSFFVEETGMIFQGVPHGFSGINGAEYCEYHFPVDIAMLHEYQLGVMFRTYDRLALYWSISFNVSESNRNLSVLGGLAVPYREGAVITDVSISPTSVIFTGVFNDIDWAAHALFFGFEIRKIELNTIEGTITLIGPRIIRLRDNGERVNRFVMIYDRAFDVCGFYATSLCAFNIQSDSVLSVVVGGEVIHFD